MNRKAFVPLLLAVGFIAVACSSDLSESEVVALIQAGISHIGSLQAQWGNPSEMVAS